MSQIKQLQEQATTLKAQALELVRKDGATREDLEQSKKLYAEAQLCSEKSQQIAALEAADQMRGAAEEKTAREAQEHKARSGPSPFFNVGDFLHTVRKAGSPHYGFAVDDRLLPFNDKEEPLSTLELDYEGGKTKTVWENTLKSRGGSKKSLVENVGASGGFLVPVEFSEQLLAVDPVEQAVAARATTIPMRRRSLRIPVLDQTGATAGQPSWFGGLIANWTEEATEKEETEPSFKQIDLVAHKLVCYTRVSDELVDDAIISMEGWLNSPMGFRGAIQWYSEYAFRRGTGVGQPLGVITAVNTPTLVVARAGAGLAVADITNMLQEFHGRNPVWHISRRQYSNLLQLNGPAANPSYVFMPNGRDGAPATLFGYPIVWDDMLPAAGTQGDILLADWTYYVIGRRQEVTFRSTDIERFRYDQTSFRAVARLDGQPWMSAPMTYQDGTTQVSPFVILGAAAGS